jgi:hypothetical protein
MRDSLARRRKQRHVSKPTPSAEFLGAARAARQRVHAWIDRDGAEMLKIAKDAKRVYDNRTTSAPLALLERTATRWRALPKEGCLSQSVTLDRRDLVIIDVRLAAAIGHCHESEADPRYRTEENEPSICAIANRLHLGKRGMDAATPILFGIKMTAVAEWYRLGFSTVWEQLMADMAELARLAPSAVAAGAPIRISIGANGGQWLGLRCRDPATAHDFLEVRSFVSSDD